jgi:hypothetical protein
MQIPLEYLDWQKTWTVKTTQSPTTGETIARIETPQKTYEVRHHNAAFAVSKVTSDVNQAMQRGQVIPTAASTSRPTSTSTPPVGKLPPQ